MSFLVIPVLGLTIVFILTVFAWYSSSSTHFSSRRGYNRISVGDEQPYEDEDGTATEDSEAEYTTRLPKTLAVLSAFLAVLVAVINVIWTALKPHEGHLIESCLFLAAWVNQVLVLEKTEPTSDYAIVSRLKPECHVVLGIASDPAL